MKKIDIQGTKTWNDGNDQDGTRPDSITVNLLANGNPIREAEVKPDADGNWKYSFPDLPKYGEGKEIRYTVTEDAVTGYSTEIEGYDINNSYTPGKTSVTVTKNWNDSRDKDGIRPDSIRVQLYADGEKEGKAIELKAGSEWTYTWSGLPQKGKGKDIEYTVKEIENISGYTVTVDDKDHGNIIITNTHTPKAITGPKTGDTGNPALYIAMMLLSAAAVAGLLAARKRGMRSF